MWHHQTLPTHVSCVASSHRHHTGTRSDPTHEAIQTCLGAMWRAHHTAAIYELSTPTVPSCTYSTVQYSNFFHSPTVKCYFKGICTCSKNCLMFRCTFRRSTGDPTSTSSPACREFNGIWGSTVRVNYVGYGSGYG